MAFEELKEHIAEGERLAQKYGETSAAYYRLRVFRLLMKGLLYFSKSFMLGLILLLFLLFLSISGAYAIGEALESTALGFLVISGIYLVFMVLAYLMRDTINRPLLRKFSEYFFHDE